MSDQQPAPSPADTAPPAPAKRKRRTGLVVVGALVLFFGGCAIGSATGGSSDDTAVASNPVPAQTVTVAASSAPQPAQTVTVTAAAGDAVAVPAETVTVPGPETTVTVTPAGSDDSGGAGGAATEITDGTYEVPTDVAPGKYRTRGAVGGADGNCYWARLSSLDGDSTDNILDNNNSTGQQVVVIKKTDKAFETTGCQPWAKVS